MVECHHCHLWFEAAWIDTHLTEDHAEQPDDEPWQDLT